MTDFPVYFKYIHNCIHERIDESSITTINKYSDLDESTIIGFDITHQEGINPDDFLQFRTDEYIKSTKKEFDDIKFEMLNWLDKKLER